MADLDICRQNQIINNTDMRQLVHRPARQKVINQQASLVGLLSKHK